MKIRFRIGPDRGSEQDGPQPPERYSSADPAVRFLDPFTLLAFTKEGNICEGSRFSGARLLQAQPVAPTPLLSRQHRAKCSAKLGESEQFSGKSNRNWLKNRSYRKQTIKPCLTGARTAHSDSRFSRDFASLHTAGPDEGRQLSRRGMLSRGRLFEPRTLRQDVQFSSISTRFWPKSRSRRKQTIKPLLPGSRIAQSVTGSLQDSRTLFVPATARATSPSASLLDDVRHGGRVLSLPGRQPRMGYIDRIQSDLTAAMKQKDELRLSVLRMMKSALKHKEIEKVRPLDDLESLQVLQTLVKQRHESVEQFTKGGRNDLAEKEAKEIKIIETYLPAAPSDEEVHRAVEAAIAEAGADSLKQMGAVIKAARSRLEGKSVDGKALSDRVRDRLTEKSAGKP
jgi:uncharacterized protein YqeY